MHIHVVVSYGNVTLNSTMYSNGITNAAELGSSKRFPIKVHSALIELQPLRLLLSPQLNLCHVSVSLVFIQLFYFQALANGIFNSLLNSFVNWKIAKSKSYVAL